MGRVCLVANICLFPRGVGEAIALEFIQSSMASSRLTKVTNAAPFDLPSGVVKRATSKSKDRIWRILPTNP